jgi:hypothetical protein
MADRPPALDLTPPPFTDGLCDWSRGDGTYGSASYENDETVRIAHGDPDLGDCLELRKTDPTHRLRYMGELPLRPGRRVEVRVRVKALRGPLPSVRIAALAGGFGGEALPDLPGEGPLVRLVGHEAVTELRAVIGREAAPGVDLVWDERALYAHVGLDVLGPFGGVLRVGELRSARAGRGVRTARAGRGCAGGLIRLPGDRLPSASRAPSRTHLP